MPRLKTPKGGFRVRVRPEGWKRPKRQESEKWIKLSDAEKARLIPRYKLRVTRDKFRKKIILFDTWVDAEQRKNDKRKKTAAIWAGKLREWRTDSYEGAEKALREAGMLCLMLEEENGSGAVVGKPGFPIIGWTGGRA